MTTHSNTQRREPIVEPSAWLPQQLEQDTSWRHRLTEAELDELLSATRAACERGLKVGEFGREDFPLPTVGPIIERLVDNVENGRGIALLSGIPVDTLDRATLGVLYWGFGGYAGDLISQNSKGQLLAEVTDKGNSYADRNTRGFATNAELLPHVDTSDMTTLLCVRQAKSGGRSRVVSSTTVYNTILEEAPEHLDVLYRGFYNDLRGEGPTGDINELTNRRIPIYSYFANRVSCSFNARMIENAINKLGEPMTGEERAAFDFMRAVTLREDLCYWFQLQPGDIQMISNHSLFHSRTNFEDFEDVDKRRCLYRFWVNIRDGRPLADNFADRYNTGSRGGVAVGDGARYEF